MPDLDFMWANAKMVAPSALLAAAAALILPLLYLAATAALNRISPARCVRDPLFRRSLKRMCAAALLAALTALSCLVFAGCKKAIPGSTAIAGEISVADVNLSRALAKPNMVCYLFLKDRWDIPIAVKRWVNPQFPLFFRLTPSDLLVPTRPWKGPYALEAAIFSPKERERELPPPATALRTQTQAAVFPGDQRLYIEIGLPTEPVTSESQLMIK